MSDRILHQLRGAVKTHGLAVEHGHQIAVRMVVLEPATHINQQGKTGGVAFGKTVFAETLDLFEQGVGKRLRVAALQHAADHAVVELVHPALALPGGHGAAQAVRLTGAETRRQHGNAHHLFLKNRHPQRAFQRFLQCLAGVDDLLRMLARLQIRVHHATLDRARSHDSHFNHQVIKTLGSEARQHAHLGPALDLEHTHSVRSANHLVSGRIFSRNVLHPQGAAALLADQVQATPDGAEHAQGQHVDLEPAHGIQIVLLPLDDRALRHGGVLHWHQTRQLVLRQHKASHMLAQMAWKALQLGAQAEPELQLQRLRRCERSAQMFQRRLQTPGQHLAAVHARMLLGQRRDQRLVNAQRTANVAQRAARTVADHYRRQSGALPAILCVDVLDYFFAPLVFKVHVNIGRFTPFAADEALKQHVHARGVDFRHAQAVADHRIGSRTAPLAQNVTAAGKGHDVVHRQKIHLVLEFGDQREFMFNLLLHALGYAFRVAPCRTFQGELTQGLGRCLTGQHTLQRVLVAQLVQAETAALRNLQRVGQQLGRIDRRESPTRAQMGFGIGLQCKAALAHRPPQTDGRHHVLQGLARAQMHVHIATGHQRHTGDA